MLDNPDVVRTFLNEARMLDEEHRSRVIAARDGYEKAFREAIGEGMAGGEFRKDVDPKITSILILSMLNAIERWYRPSGPLDRQSLVGAVVSVTLSGIR
jgi:hypothetical protein